MSSSERRWRDLPPAHLIRLKEVKSVTQLEDLAESQREVQRQLGRCLLRLQLYEVHVKAFVAHSELTGTPTTLASNHAKNTASVANKTLGQLVGELTGRNILALPSPDPSDETSPPEKEVVDSDEAHFSFKFRIEMSGESYAEIAEGMVSLVALRNELVHHFIERFDLSTGTGCQEALVHLQRCFETIDSQFAVVRRWVETLERGRKDMADLMRSEAFIRMLIGGDDDSTGEVNWPDSGIVKLLRSAEGNGGGSEWTALSAAIAHARRNDGGETPKRYGCKTWRQVLKKSGLFEMRVEKAGSGQATLVWYRSKAPGDGG